MREKNQNPNKLGAEEKPERLKWTPELVKRFWDGISHTRLSELSFSKQGGRSLIIAINHLLTDEAHILDFGAGDGHLLQYMCKRGLSAAAYEPSQERGKEIIKSLSNYPRFLGIIDSTSDKTFDVVIMAEVIEHILEEELDKTLTQVAKYIKPGGYLVVTTPNNEDLDLSMVYCPVSNQLFHRWQHIRSFTEETLGNLLSQYGIKELVTHQVEFNDAVYIPGDPVWGGDQKNEDIPSYVSDMRINKATKMGSESNLLFIGRKEN